MLRTRLPIGIKTQSGLDDMLALGPQTQANYLAEHEPIGFNLVLLGLVTARNGARDNRLWRARQELRGALGEDTDLEVPAWRWVARGYWLHAEQLAANDDRADVMQLWRTLFFGSSFHSWYLERGYKVLGLDEEHQVEVGRWRQNFAVVLRQIPEPSSDVYALNPGDEVLAHRDMAQGVCCLEAEHERYVFDRWLVPALPATAEMVEQLTYNMFYLARYDR